MLSFTFHCAERALFQSSAKFLSRRPPLKMIRKCDFWSPPAINWKRFVAPNWLPNYTALIKILSCTESRSTCCRIHFETRAKIISIWIFESVLGADFKIHSQVWVRERVQSAKRQQGRPTLLRARVGRRAHFSFSARVTYGAPPKQVHTHAFFEAGQRSREMISLVMFIRAAHIETFWVPVCVRSLVCLFLHFLCSSVTS